MNFYDIEPMEIEHRSISYRVQITRTDTGREETPVNPRTRSKRRIWTTSGIGQTTTTHVHKTLPSYRTIQRLKIQQIG